jgi:hypothetical protein
LFDVRVEALEKLFFEDKILSLVLFEMLEMALTTVGLIAVLAFNVGQASSR